MTGLWIGTGLAGNNALSIAKQYSLSDFFVGLAILSVGNIIGGNILDTLLPIGITAVFSPVLFEREFLLFELPCIFIMGLVTLYFFVRARGLQKREAAVILGLYLLYLLIKYSQQ